jgi:hypothetical protein
MDLRRRRVFLAGVSGGLSVWPIAVAMSSAGAPGAFFGASWLMRGLPWISNH